MVGHGVLNVSADPQAKYSMLVEPAVVSGIQSSLENKGKYRKCEN